jgi:hypothetical protein
LLGRVVRGDHTVERGALCRRQVLAPEQFVSVSSTRHPEAGVIDRRTSDHTARLLVISLFSRS